MNHPSDARTVLAGGPDGLVADLIDALEVAHARLAAEADHHDYEYDTGHDRVAARLRGALANPSETGWWLGRAYEVAAAGPLGILADAIRELGIAHEVIAISRGETRYAGKVTDRVHAAIDHLGPPHQEDGW